VSPPFLNQLHMSTAMWRYVFAPFVWLRRVSRSHQHSALMKLMS